MLFNDSLKHIAILFEQHHLQWRELVEILPSIYIISAAPNKQYAMLRSLKLSLTNSTWNFYPKNVFQYIAQKLAYVAGWCY